MTDAYAILGLDRAATPEQARAAYRRLVREHHPDRHVRTDGTVSPSVHERFVAVTKAYDRVLSDLAGPRATVPHQRRAPAIVPQQRPATTGSAGPRLRELDPMVLLLTLPQETSRTWTAEALEAWALVLVPQARRHLAEAGATARAAGPITGSDLAHGTAHALLTATLRSTHSRQLSALAPFLPAAYAHLERRLPGSVLRGLPLRASVGASRGLFGALRG